MRIKFLRNAEYPQIKKDGSPDPERSKSYKAGEVYDVSDDHARRWLRRNAAVVADDEEVEKPAKQAKSQPVASMVPAAPTKG